MSLETFERLPADRREGILSAGIREFSRKSYKDVRMEDITEACRISKGILFHYFGSKKEFYLYCLESALARLTERTEPVTGEGFYGVLFAAMDRKIALCRRYENETRMANMASRDVSGEILRGKAELLRRYADAIQAESALTLRRALEALGPENPPRPLAAAGLQIYVSALLSRYLLAYQQDPDGFFQNAADMKRELREYLDLMLFGICGTGGAS